MSVSKGVFEAFALCFVWVLALPRIAHAYVDPSVMTYTIQALAGVAVALSALAGVVFRRVRRKVFKTFNIDENANKAVESKISRIAPDDEDASRSFHDADERAARLYEESLGDSEKRGIEGLTWKKRFAFSLLMCVFAFFVILVAPAIEVFGANSDSLVFGVQKVWWITAAINGALAVACAFALSALRGRGFLAALLFVFCLAFAAYVQSFFMNAGMMPADGGYIGWGDWFFVQKMIVSGVVWLAILIVPQIISRRHRYAWLQVTSAIAVLIIIMQAFGVGSVAVSANETSVAEKDHPYVTQGGLCTVSPHENVIVFVLDTYDTSIIEQLRVDHPEILDNFADFTYFRNSVGMMIPTMNALPYMLSGVKPEPGESLEHYRATRYERSSFIPTLYDAGYSIGLYTDSAMFDYRNPADLAIARDTINIHPMDKVPINIWDTYLVLNQCALYREAPWVAKPTFWYYTSDINNRMMGDAESQDGNDALYEVDDAKVLATFKSEGLAASDTQGKGAFRLIHLFGPHFPYNVDEDGNDIGVNQSDPMRQAQGTLKVVGQYIAELKRLGLYDGATIIVTADHGVWDEREDPIAHAVSPIMMVKPSVSPDTAGRPCDVSNMPVSHEDLIPTIIDAIGESPDVFGSGKTVWQIDDPDRVRLFDALTSKGEGGRRFVEYQITGDALDLQNWSKTGIEWLGA